MHTGIKKNMNVNVTLDPLPPFLKPRSVVPFILNETCKYSGQKAVTTKPVYIPHFQQYTQGLHKQYLA